ncbi:MAG TPA: hypothetical protein VFN25_13100 [Dokdonella sp.]|uniref:hypothetical protein n=1 Tax=Dokdonella sp. TaxID=2291710 RepID=UPI002D810810|nr:hypothetical protein [Dokdonella sp.]HET9033825.1 hypothetical protein [Dokdonella sp.]
MNVIEGSIIGVLALAALLGALRVLRGTRPWRWTRVLGHGLMAALLYLLIFPPAIDLPRETGIILTPGVGSRQIDERKPGVPTLALPSVETSDPTILEVPDLATGLRQHPEIGDLRVLGDGLPARDREVVGDRGLVFEPGRALQGIVELSQPDFVREGAAGTVRGRAVGKGELQLRLRDRSDQTVATTTADAEGGFALGLRAKAPGETLYRLQLLDDQEKVIEEVPLPIVVVDGDSVRTLILSGGPDADLKYLRRWIVDSGNIVASRIGLSRGIDQKQNAPSLSAEVLAETDLLIIDQRAWAGLSSSAKTLVRTAVEQGLGLLLRVTGPLPAAVASDWKGLGFEIKPADVSRSVALVKPLPDMTLARAPVEMTSNDVVAYAVDADGSVLVAWRAIAQGRVGAWLPLDSYRLQLSGDSIRYGSLWSGIFTRVSRARGNPLPALPARPRVGERSVLCELEAGASIEDPDARRHELLIDTTANACAAWWPEQPGWHHLDNAGAQWPVFVYPDEAGRSLVRAERHQATAQLQQDAPKQTSYRATLPRWKLFLAWLLVCSVFWWLERR